MLERSHRGLLAALAGALAALASPAGATPVDVFFDGPSTAVRVLQELERAGQVAAGSTAQAIERYRLHDVTAGTSGNAGGES